VTGLTTPALSRAESVAHGAFTATLGGTLADGGIGPQSISAAGSFHVLRTA